MNAVFSMTLQTIKNKSVYQLVIPVGVPYEEAHEAGLELAAGVLEIQKKMIQQDEEQKLKQEMVNAKAETESSTTESSAE